MSESIYQTFKVNDKELKLNEHILNNLTEYLAKINKTSIGQPNLVVGKSGNGKTHLLNNINSYIENELKDSLVPVLIDGRSLFTLDELWNYCLSVLKIEIQPGNDKIKKILEWQTVNAKRSVLLIDNIEYLFDRISSENLYELRGILNSNEAPLIVATSSVVHKGFTDYRQPFFEGFKILYLKPFSLEETAGLNHNLKTLQRIEKIMSYLPKTVRSYLISLYIVESSRNLNNDMPSILNIFSIEYKHQYESYPVTAQLILNIMASMPDNVTLSEIKQQTSVDNSIISPYLTNMVRRKILKKRNITTRTGVYKITDPLFKLWLQNYVVFSL